MVPFGRNKEFVGREHALKRLLQLVPPSHERDNCQRTVVEGLGGVGKTQIALEVVYRIRDEYPDCHIFCVPQSMLLALRMPTEILAGSSRFLGLIAI